MGELLTTKQTAAWLQVSVETVRDWTRDGLLPVIRLRGPVRRYDRDAVLASLRARQTQQLLHEAKRKGLPLTSADQLKPKGSDECTP